MKDFRDRVVAITGAGSGIGRALAAEFAARGSHVALSDIDDEGLAGTDRRCRERGVAVRSDRLDVSDRDAVFAWADAVVAEHGRVNVIVNNAGVALGATAESQTIEDFEWLMSINFWGVVHGTQAFLPHLRSAGEGHVVNVSSVFGLLSIPTQSAYNASKFGVRGFTDALRMELEIEGCDVSATTVHPGGIKTDIARRARTHPSVGRVGGDPEGLADEFERRARTTPETAARKIVKAIERNRRRTLIGPDAIAFDLVSRLPAAFSQRLMVAGARRELRRQS